MSSVFQDTHCIILILYLLILPYRLKVQKTVRGFLFQQFAASPRTTVPIGRINFLLAICVASYCQLSHRLIQSLRVNPYGSMGNELQIQINAHGITWKWNGCDGLHPINSSNRALIFYIKRPTLCKTFCYFKLVFGLI